MLPVLGIIARLAMVVGMSYVLGKTVPRMPNILTRFVFLFVLFVPMNFVINYADVRLLGYHKMGWTGEFAFALLFAIFGTFWPPQSHNSNTP